MRIYKLSSTCLWNKSHTAEVITDQMRIKEEVKLIATCRSKMVAGVQSCSNSVGKIGFLKKRKFVHSLNFVLEIESKISRVPNILKGRTLFFWGGEEGRKWNFTKLDK